MGEMPRFNHLSHISYHKSAHIQNQTREVTKNIESVDFSLQQKNNFASVYFTTITMYLSKSSNFIESEREREKRGEEKTH